MKFLKMIVFLLPLLAVFGCGSNALSGQENNISDRTILTTSKDENLTRFIVLKNGQVPYDYTEYSEGVKASLVYHSDDMQDVQNFSAEYMRLIGEEAPVFDGTMIIVKMGTKSTGGYGYKLKEVVQNNTHTEVTLAVSTPDALATMALTNPYIIIYLPQNYQDVKVIEVQG